MRDGFNKLGLLRLTLLIIFLQPVILFLGGINTMEKDFEITSNNANLSNGLNINDTFQEKLWNKNFLLLLQGQIVSVFGDNIYDMALRFWVLSNTGSTTLMGILMAATIIPSVFISPLAGTFIDRHDRRKILIAADIIRGISILAIGLLALNGHLQLWLVLISGIIMGVCGCFFSPSIDSAMPDIIPKSKILKGTSIFSLASTGNEMAGNAFGGFLVQILGAPILFVFNGLSFLFSAACTLFVKIPSIPQCTKDISFFDDLKLGMNFVRSSKGLRNLLITMCFFNFCASMSMTLTLPLFQAYSHLGIGFYGIAMAINTFGMFLGFTYLSLIEIKKEKRFFALISSGIVLSITMIVYSLTLNLYLISIMFFIDGFCIAVLSSIIQSSIQKCTPSNIRSKVFAFKNTLSSALMPLGMILAGILGEKVKMNLIICGDYIGFLLLFIYLATIANVKEIVNL